MRAEPRRWACAALVAGLALAPHPVGAEADRAEVVVPVERRVSTQIEDGQPPVPTRDPDEARDRAEEILARPEFQPEEEGFIERGLDWVGRKIGEALVRGTGSGSSALGWVLLIALLALVAWLVRGIRPTARRTAVVPEPAVAVEERRSPKAWADAAREHEAAGRWVEALRCRYRGLVAELVEREVVRDIPGSTVGEYRDDVAGAIPSALEPFRDATAVYEDAWFGHAGAGPAERDRFEVGARSVLDEVAR